MYSMVIMAALSTGSAAPDCCFRHWGCSPCYSACYGCVGCYGCAGCYGGCYGGWYGGCYGGCYGAYAYASGCYGCLGYPMVSPYQVVPSSPMPKAGETAPPPKETKQEETKAKLIIEVPSDAKLFIDNQPMKTTSSRRAFSTPVLEAGQAYYYVVRAEITRDGQTYELSKRVIVRAGEQVKASFKDLESSPAYIAKANTNR